MHQSPYICISLVKRIQLCKISVRLKWIPTLMLLLLLLFYSLCWINISRAGFSVAQFTWQVGESEEDSGDPWVCEQTSWLQEQFRLPWWQVRCSQTPPTPLPPLRLGVGYELEVQAKGSEAMSPVLRRTDWSHSRVGKMAVVFIRAEGAGRDMGANGDQNQKVS